MKKQNLYLNNLILYYQREQKGLSLDEKKIVYERILFMSLESQRSQISQRRTKEVTGHRLKCIIKIASLATWKSRILNAINLVRQREIGTGCLT